MFEAQYHQTMNSKEHFDEKIAKMKGEQAKNMKMFSDEEVIFLLFRSFSVFDDVFIFLICLFF